MNPVFEFYNLGDDGEIVKVSSEKDLTPNDSWLVAQDYVPEGKPEYLVKTTFLGYDGDKSPWLAEQHRRPKCFCTKVSKVDEDKRYVGDDSTIFTETREDALSQHKYAVVWCKKLVDNDRSKQ